MRWLRQVRYRPPATGIRAAGYDAHYDGKWYISHADLIDPHSDGPLATNDDDGIADHKLSSATSMKIRWARATSPDGSDPSRARGAVANAGVQREALIAKQDRGIAEGPLSPPPGQATQMRCVLPCRWSVS